MRKTLLMAAAALAAGVISSQAGVYSANIVGYANVVTPTAGKNYLISVPFTVGVSNGANEVFGSTLPPSTSLLLWTGNGYQTYIYDPTDPDGLGAGAPVWYYGNDSTPAVIPTLPPGLGFFISPTAPFTNTFVGSVAVSVGTSNNIVLATGGHNYLVSSPVPYAGAITNGNSSTGGLNLNNLPPSSSLLIWNGNGYNTALYDPTDPDGLGASAPNWYQGNDSTPYVDPATGGNVPTVTVGQGFFLSPSAPYTWTVGL